jgi:hypothetical protein
MNDWARAKVVHQGWSKVEDVKFCYTQQHHSDTQASMIEAGPCTSETAMAMAPPEMDRAHSRHIYICAPC